MWTRVHKILKLTLSCITNYSKAHGKSNDPPLAVLGSLNRCSDKCIRTSIKAPLFLSRRVPQYLFITSLYVVATTSHVGLGGGRKAASTTAAHCTHSALLSFSRGGKVFFCNCSRASDECLVCCQCPLWCRLKRYKCFPVLDCWVGTNVYSF